MNRLVAFAQWLFRDRATGKFVVGQFPNVPLIAWLVATGLSAVSTGATQTLFGYLAAAALVVWAGDELLRGVNPFRRLLGAGVLVWKMYSLLQGG